MIRQIVKRQTPGLVLDQPLGGVAMEVELAEIAKNLSNSLARLINCPFV